MKTQNNIKLFLGVILFMAILSIIMGCSQSGNLKDTSVDSSINRISRARTIDHLNISVYLGKLAPYYKVGDTVIVMTIGNVEGWYLIETPTYNKDTITARASYKKVTLIK